MSSGVLCLKKLSLSETCNHLWCHHFINQDLFRFLRLNGTYESLIGGTLAEALVDLTGGVPETIEMKPYVDDEAARLRLFNDLKTEFHDNHALMAAAIAVRKLTRNAHLKNFEMWITFISQCLKGKLRNNYQMGLWWVTPIPSARLRKSHWIAISRVFGINCSLLPSKWWWFDWWIPGVKRSGTDGGQMGRTIYSQLLFKSLMTLIFSSVEWSAVSEDQRNKLGLKIEEDGEFW